MKILLMLLSLSAFAFGHTTFLQNSGFGSGFLHPIGGLDHVLAMVGVGMVAFFASKRGYLLLFAFITAMLIAAILGFMGVKIPFVEEGILISIAVVFAFLGFAKKIPVNIIVTVVAFFGLFHGFAHGAEFQSGSFVAYMLGFTLSTLFLHLSGIALAYAYTKSAKTDAKCVVEKEYV
ncbi:HupE/UreJ family protein [Sulfurimonas sp.]|jgi:urease accessory protein|uniref:HupE/UreJ family protein n=1 Tax=Sulfurimonas sp. TaxID=2022749 RepID=UPI0025D1E5C6|nr:HupE/UreJ family protein [Sulfurimonas sp.]MCK9474190.1 HupE/UreJ family protein [Sulfurimonas sp.]MDD3506237.1 HupE/UreJ family protein [Sulfurimonas sp.]